MNKIADTCHSGSVTSPSPERLRLVASAAKRWQDALIDESGRNQLAYYRDLKAGTLRLNDAQRPALQRLLAGDAVTLKQLFPDTELRTDALRRTRAVRKQMRMWAEERGVEVGYLTTGMATWNELARTPRSPVLIQQLTIKPTSLAENDYSLRADPEASINPVLLHKLEKDHGVVIPVEEFLDLDIELLFEKLAKLAADVAGFSIQSGHLVGTFTYAKLPIVDDMREHLELLASHDVIAALAGDRDALRALESHSLVAEDDEIPLDAPDRVTPAQETLVLDADSSQNHAINAVLAGEHLVIKGPPGTGKSQTIANMIAALAARGKTTLFVAEKRAAIDAVLNRLEQVGLGDLVYNLHGEQASRRELARALESRLQRARTEAKPHTEELDRRMLNTRTPLVDHHDAMHKAREPWGVSAYTVQAYLLGMPPESQTSTRWTGAELRSLHGDFAEEVGSSVVELARLPIEGPWGSTEVVDRDVAEDAYILAGETAMLWAHARKAVTAMTGELGLTPVTTPAGARAAVQLVTEVDETLSKFDASCFTVQLGRWKGFWERRRSLKQMRSLWSARKKPPRDVLRKAAAAIADQKDRWQRARDDDGLPRACTTLAEAQQRLAAALEALDRLYAYVPLDDLEVHLDRLAVDQTGLLNALRRNELLDFLHPWSVETLAAQGDPDLADQRFTYAWLQSILDHLRFSDDRLGRFHGAQLHAQAAQYRQTDIDHLSSAAGRVRYQAARKMIEVLDAFPDQQRLVRSEAAKKIRHMPVRRLFDMAPDALTALKPCWAMSPLLASQVLPARRLFDVVIFDEASQVEPVDAITAIMRGNQIVVAGDEHQLPPTAFFHRTSDEDPDYDENLDNILTEDIESLLQSFANALPLAQVKHLSWHYRSRDERLIAFSNAHIYAATGNPLVTFPGADGEDCLRHVLVTKENSEADRVVKLVLEHAAQRPDESLGVITMGLKHAEAVEAALRQALAKRSDHLAAFFAETGAEPFFIKSIERVQGDERDAIILSVGYSRNTDGRMVYRFGPLNNKGGERRLNVAITRAKHRITLVSSFRHVDLDAHRLRSQGAKLLGAYLEYAASGGQALTSRQHGTQPLNPLEADMRARLTAAGIPVFPHYGVSGSRIDFAAHHPDDPSRMVLAIESDGGSYHALPTTRDRERLRRQLLERLGWRYHRVWSTDWFNDREREIERLQVAYRKALVTTPDWVAVLSPPAATPEPARPVQRGQRPELPEFDEIGDIPEPVLADLIAWIESDGLNRTEDEVVTETIAELGFQRRGPRIVEAIIRTRRSGRSQEDVRKEY